MAEYLECQTCGHKTKGDSVAEVHNRMATHICIRPGTIDAAVEGLKHDGGKPRWDLLPWEELLEVAKVMEFGARKYAPDNWKKVEGGPWRYLRAGIGHLAARASGERRDPESGLPHLAHAVCCCLFLLWFDRHEDVPAVNIERRI